MAKKKKELDLNDFYNGIARKSDKKKVQINAADTRRVIACFFDQLEDYSAAQAFAFVAKGLARAKGRRR